MNGARTCLPAATGIKVAICITGLEVGGAETLLASLLERIPDDIEVRVFPLIDGGEVASRVASAGTPVVGLHMRAGRPGIRPLLALAGHLRRYRPDIVYTWLYHADLVGGVAAKLARTPHVIWHLHNSDLSPDRVRLMTRMVVRACALLSRTIPATILSCSESGLRVHEARGYRGRDMRYLPNGVDTRRFAPSADARATVRDEFGFGTRPLIGLIARLDPQKNHEGFFEAVRLFFERGGDADFLLVGRGVVPEDARLRELADATGHAERIAMVGPRDDVPRLLSALDVATSSSLGEAFPMTLIEAMACGVPCAVTDVGDCATIVGDTGLVVPPNDGSALADAWARLLELPADERDGLGQRARERVIDHYAVEEFANQVWALCRETVAR